MQLSNVAVLDNCKSAYNDGVKCQVRCLWGQVGTRILVNANLAGVGELCWQLAELSVLGVELCASIRLPARDSLHNTFFVEQLLEKCPYTCPTWPYGTIAKLYISMVLIEISMSLHVFLHSDPLFASPCEGYAVCKLNFLVGYVDCHSISKYALEIMPEQTRRGAKNGQIASI